MADYLEPATTEGDIAAEAAALVRAGRREEAGRLLYRKLGNRVLRYLARRRVPDADAEELLATTFCNFLMSDMRGDGQHSAIALLWTIAERAVIDFVRHKNAQCRGGQVEGGALEISLDDDSWLALLDTSHGAFSVPDWVRDCVHRAAALFQHDKPRQAEILMLHAEGHSHQELALLLGADPGDTSGKPEKAAKSRVHHACKLAREYFEECKEA
ncbi:MAG: sigma-70 family RNA polymerase sigma factor [Pseudomonadota bacterium]